MFASALPTGWRGRVLSWIAGIAALAASALALSGAQADASYLFVASGGSALLRPYSIAADGSVARVACGGSSCTTGLGPWGVAVTPNGRYVYTTDGKTGLVVGAVSGFAIAADGTLSPLACSSEAACATQLTPEGIAVSPAGGFLYVANRNSKTVSIFAIAADGTLTPVFCHLESQCHTPSFPESIAVAPNGRFLYVANGSKISPYAIAADGTIAPLPCTAGCDTKAGALTEAAITPSGEFLYALGNGGEVEARAIAADGSLSEVPCSHCAAGVGGGGLAIAPSGRYVYDTSETSPAGISIFAIGPEGALTPEACSPAARCQGGKMPIGITLDPAGNAVYAVDYPDNALLPFAVEAGGLLQPLPCGLPSDCSVSEQGPYTQSVAAQPDQGPTAALAVTPAPAGSPTVLDASGSSAAAGGQVVRWDWNLGDGTVLSSAGPTIAHVYAAAGAYTASVTVTDEDGCSTSLIFTGQTAYCNGSPAASTSAPVTIAPAAPPAPSPSAPPPPPPAPLLSHVGESAKTWRDGGSLARISSHGRSRRAPVGTTFSFSLNVPARVTFAFYLPTGGRLVGKTCVAQTRSNEHRRHCTREAEVASLAFAAHAATNGIRFEGRLSKHHWLGTGAYTLLLNATASGGRSPTSALHFTITH